MKKISVRIFLASVFFFGVPALSPSAFAQSNADLSGITRDTDGAVIPRVKVKARNTATNLTRETQSDEEGRYAFPSLPIGNYEVTAISAGFQETKVTTELTVGQKTELEVILKPAGISANVIVEAGERLAPETSTSMLGQLVSKRQIENLPLNGRDFSQLVLLQPGTTQARSDQGDILSGKGAKISVHGARTNENSYLLDGTDILDALGRNAAGAQGLVSGIESVQEFTVLTNTYSAEYGRAAGGVFNIATRSGGNKFHATLFEYHRNSALDARNFFDGKKPPLKRNQFGFSVGGPIVRDKLFIFGTYEGFRERLGLTDTQFVPSLAARRGAFLPAGASISPAVLPYLAIIPLPTTDNPTGEKALFQGQFTQPSNANSYNVRADYNFSKRDSLFVRYTKSDSDIRFIGAEVFSNFPNIGTNDQTFLTIGETRVFSGGIVNSMRYARNHTFPSESPDPVDPSSNLAFVPGESIVGDVNISGFKRFGSDRNTPRSFRQNLNQFSDDLAFVRGGHSMKMGGNFEHFDILGVSASRNRGEFTINTFSDFLRGRARDFVGLDPAQKDVNRHHRQNLIGFYFQDDWKAWPNLVLNLGLRYEFITVPTEVDGKITNVRTPTDPAVTVGGPLFRNPSKGDFAPRVGFAYSPDFKDSFLSALTGGPGKMSIRGGFGIYYEQLLYSTYGNMTFKHSPFFTQIRITTGGPCAAPTTCAPFPNVAPLLTSGVGQIDTFAIDFNAQPTYVMQYNLNIQREFSSRFVVTAAYVGSRGIHLWREADFNNAIPLDDTGTRFAPIAANLVRRRNPNFANIRFKTSDAQSFYNAFQLGIASRLGHSFQGQLSYTFAKSIDDQSSSLGRNEFGNGQARTVDPYNKRLNRGLSDFDVRHNLSINFVYDLPFGRDGSFANSANRIVHGLFSGWQLSGILTAQTGIPVSPIFTFDQDRDGTTDNEQRPNLAPGVTRIPTNISRTQLFDPSVFVLPAVGFRGTLGRNVIPGPRLFTFDPAVVKSFYMNADHTRSLQFRTEIFNIFNHANFAIPEVANLTIFNDATTRNTTAGQITKTSTPSRQIQFALRFIF
ncbi:MAG TPA: carboxypeptidase regulatory-like domain-containing protein [Pyrinomonadaceae bacterium]